MHAELFHVFRRERKTNVEDLPAAASHEIRRRACVRKYYKYYQFRSATVDNTKRFLIIFKPQIVYRSERQFSFFFFFFLWCHQKREQKNHPTSSNRRRFNNITDGVTKFYVTNYYITSISKLKNVLNFIICSNSINW